MIKVVTSGRIFSKQNKDVDVEKGGTDEEEESKK